MDFNSSIGTNYMATYGALAAMGPGASRVYLCLEDSSKGSVFSSGFWVERTPVHEAAQRGESLQLQQLIESGACVNQVTVDSITPLHAASLQGQAQCVQLLLAAGAQVGDHLVTIWDGQLPSCSCGS